MATYIRKDHQRLGPFDDNEVLAGLRDHRYFADDLAWLDGMADWKPLRDVSNEGYWVVVSFHTVPAEDLIEERPDPGSAAGTKQMVYLEERMKVEG